MKIIAVSVLSLCLQISPGFSQKSTIPKERKTDDYSLFYSASDVHLVFDKAHKPNVLTKEQLSALWSIIRRVSDSLNLVVTSTNVVTQKTDTLYHRFQIVSAKDNKGGKKVWVHAVCDPSTEWRKRLFFVDDGGSCYYNFKVDVNRGNYFDIAFY